MLLLLSQISAAAITPALAMLPPKMDSPQARVMLLAIGLQESRLAARVQRIAGGGAGPARGLWQFEQGGGVRGVLGHVATQQLARAVCGECRVAATALAVWGELQHDDVLAAAFARLLLYSDPRPLPALGQAAAAWDLYARTWRPGKPHPETWPGLYGQALAAVQP